MSYESKMQCGCWFTQFSLHCIPYLQNYECECMNMTHMTHFRHMCVCATIGNT